MFNVGDVVIVKELQTLIDNGDLKLVEDLGDIYCNKDKKFVLFPNFRYYGVECTVNQVDKKDKDIPYFLSIGIWVPEFMIELKPEPKKDIPKPDEPVEIIPNIILDNREDVVLEAPAIDKLDAVKEENNNKENNIINKFNNKPFGKLFIKLILLNPKIAEFSNTSFSRLKKHELQYIAKVLQDHGRVVINYNEMTQKELASYCYIETSAL